MKQAVFAGGCFWCMVKPFDTYPGVIKVEVGYTGGHKENPTYEEVCHHETGHREAVKITYDEKILSYEDLVEIFFRSIDPTDPDGQFNDRGETYKTAVYYEDEEQREIAEAYVKKLEAKGIYEKPIVVPILPSEPFYGAEDYHQDYYKKNAFHYNLYYKGSGRKKYIEEHAYSNPYKEEELRERLTPIQYKVTQENGTELPYTNAFCDHDEEGIYVDIVSGKPLFSSQDKFDSGCGWPAFSQPIYGAGVYEKEDISHGMHRVEVRSSYGDSHLGHVFPDGPVEKGGMRYCINSAALRFIPKEKMKEEGYGAYLSLFEA